MTRTRVKIIIIGFILVIVFFLQSKIPASHVHPHEQAQTLFTPLSLGRVVFSSVPPTQLQDFYKAGPLAQAS